MDELRFVDACTEEHFKAMSLIHALGWRDTYAEAVPADYMAREITDDRWVEVFRQNYESQNGVHGLLLYRGDVPVSCLNYCKARTVNYNPGRRRGSGTPLCSSSRRTGGRGGFTPDTASPGTAPARTYPSPTARPATTCGM